jgi:hypothetical protein
MIDTIKDLTASLQVQQEKLAAEIRAAESSLITTKEGYLKVQGALEILEILEARVEEQTEEDKENISIAID